MKVQIGIFECTGIMGQDLVHPYIQSTTVLWILPILVPFSAHFEVLICTKCMFVNALLNHPSYLFHKVVQPTTSDVHQPTTSSSPDVHQVRPTTPPRTSSTPPPPVVTPAGSKFYSHVTEGRRADYSVYIITGNGHTVAVLIEAKHTGHHMIKHAIAQVTGYFVAFTTMAVPPLVFILTEDYVQVILYPFVSSAEVALINGVVLPPFPIFTDNEVPNLCTLGMVLTLANYSTKPFKIILPEFCTLSMSRVDLMGKVVTKQQAEIAKLKEEYEREMNEKEAQFKREINELKQQLQKAQGEHSAVSIGCT